MLSNLKEKLEKSALLKTIIGIFSLVVFSILSGAFITEITHDGSLDWSFFYKTKSFYILIACCILMYFYFKFIFFIDQSVEQFMDDEYCKAYMRKQCLPEVAKKVNGLIKKGKSTDEVRNIMSDLNL